MTTQERQRRWYHLTPTRFFVGLLAVQVFLLLSERFRWFAFNEHKGWTVLIAVGVVVAAVLVMLVWIVVILCLRQRFQFSFRSLLFFLAVLSIPLAWFAWEMDKARRQREVVERIVTVRGPVLYDYQERKLRRGVIPPPSPPGWLPRLLGHDFFCDLVVVDWSRSPIGDDDLSPMRRMTKLERLWLNDTQITNRGLAHLEEMAELRMLSLGKTQITDGGLAHLGKMTKLELLNLVDTQISDDGLADLEGMTELEQLWLVGTQVTDEGVEKLQQALPSCYIEH
jgi:hypothetical protein